MQMPQTGVTLYRALCACRTLLIVCLKSKRYNVLIQIVYNRVDFDQAKLFCHSGFWQIYNFWLSYDPYFFCKNWTAGNFDSDGA